MTSQISRKLPRLEMGDIKSLDPDNRKRQEFVLFLSSLVPTPKVTTNGDFGFEFPVIGYLADKATKLVVKKLKKNKKDPAEQELKPKASDDEKQKESKS